MLTPTKMKLGLVICLLLLVVLFIQFYSLFLNFLLVYSQVGQIQNPTQWIQVIVIRLWQGENFTVPEKPSLCGQPYTTGLCRGMFPRFYYDPEQDDCLTFIYGGCQGNDNNFRSADECLAVCKPSQTLTVAHEVHTKSANEICGQEADAGQCRASYDRFYFDTGKQSCLGFIYGGCDGNDNNFESKEDCINTCGGEKPKRKPKIDDICQLPAEIGLCRALIPRFYYDAKKGICAKFNYGGCMGNENNFKTENDCMNKCGHHSNDILIAV